ncbi:hypothetical protein [Asanoa siamensis]|uniref:Uncharacterized protein n=1 Tax=Asanoa siamensis TaxID=926357 RepID=A0ABQ4CKU6_9ACTN|nr:hypothetical protein [Asanoa siamensis]GIF71920.1 hypothetical protein Asi02nite_14380 [Asanoa siamensis]
MDQLGEAVRAFKAAQAALPRAEERADQLVADARARISEARAALAAEIVAEYENGARVNDLAHRSGYTRETIRRILRAAGIPPD